MYLQKNSHNMANTFRMHSNKKNEIYFHDKHINSNLFNLMETDINTKWPQLMLNGIKWEMRNNFCFAHYSTSGKARILTVPKSPFALRKMKKLPIL